MSDTEQKQEDERAKTLQLSKEMRKARSNQHYRMEERQAWMTQGATGPSSEDYLLGKEVKSSKTAVREEVNQMQEATGALLAKTKKTSTVLEAEARLREDPMMMFQRAEIEERKKIVTNPVKMKKITDKVTLLRELKKAAKKAKKESKKKQKKKKRKGSDSDSSDSSDVEADTRSRSSGNGAHGSSSSHQREDDRGGRRGDGPATKPMIPAAMAAKYGLIHPNGARAAAGLVRNTSPSPDRAKPSGGGLVKNEENSRSGTKRERSAEPASAPAERPKGRRPTQMTEEEKQRRLLEMQADASVHDKASFERMIAHKTQLKKEDDQFRAGDRTITNSASFIKDLNKEIFAGKESLEDRLNKHKHYRQKGSTEMHSFLSK